MNAPIHNPERPCERLVVIGNGMAGCRAVEEILARDPTRYTITIFGAEPRVNYNRIMLSPVLAGDKSFDEIIINDTAWYADNRITLVSGDPVAAIDREARTVTARSGHVQPYDRLLIATGSDPFIIPVPGKDLTGVVTFRDLDDVDTMLKAAAGADGQPGRAVVIGGGLLGLEAAHGLNLRGMLVTVIHLMPTLMERQLDVAADPAIFAALVDLVAAHPRMVTLFSQGANQSTSGTDKGGAITNLHLATGRIGSAGAGPFSITGQPNAMGGREVGGLANQLACHLGFSGGERADVAAFWQTDRVCTGPGLKAVAMFRAIHAGRIKFLWVMATNPAVSMPDAGFVREALARCPTVVVSDCIAETDTARFAHIRLPALGWAEKDGTVTIPTGRSAASARCSPPPAKRAPTGGSSAMSPPGWAMAPASISTPRRTSFANSRR